MAPGTPQRDFEIRVDDGWGGLPTNAADVRAREEALRAEQLAAHQGRPEYPAEQRALFEAAQERAAAEDNEVLASIGLETVQQVDPLGLSHNARRIRGSFEGAGWTDPVRRPAGRQNPTERPTSQPPLTVSADPVFYVGPEM